MILASVKAAFAGCSATNTNISFCDTTQIVAAPTASTSSLTIDGASTLGVYYGPAANAPNAPYTETLTVTGGTAISNAGGQLVVNGGAGISVVSVGAGAVPLNATVTLASDVTIVSRAEYGGGVFLRTDAGGNLSINNAGTITVTGINSSNVQVPDATVISLGSSAGTYTDGMNAVTGVGSASITNSGTITSYSGRGIYAEGNVNAIVLDGNENIVSTSAPAVTVSADNTATGTIHSFLAGIRVINYYGLAQASNEGSVHSGNFQAIIAWSSAGDTSVTNAGTATSDDRNAVVAETERGNATILNSGSATAGMLSSGSHGAAAGYSGLRIAVDYAGDATITNTAAGTVTATHDAAIVDHTPQGNATVTNQGQVTGLNGVFIDSGAGLGTIDTLNDTSGPAANTITGPATLNNSGTITATAYAAYLDGTTNTLTNSGTITTTGTTAIVTGNGNSTVTNSGTIAAGSAAGTAISFGSGTNRLVLYDTSSITGIVTNVSTNNTLELTGTGSGTLALGQVSSSGTYQGFANLDKTGTGQWTLTGSGSSLTGTAAVDAGTLTLNGSLSVNTLTVGSSVSQGTLSVTGGGSLTASSDSAIGGLGGPNGSSITSANAISGVATISGTGSALTDNGILSIGRGGTGSVTVASGGTLQTSALVIGSSSFDTVPGSGSLTVTGTGASWTNGATGIGGVDIGRIAGSTGTLTIADGASATLRGNPVEAGGGSAISISGSATHVQIGDPTSSNPGTWLTVGGTATVSGGATVYADGLYVNQGGTSGTASVTVTGPGTNLTAGVRIYVGGLDGGPGSAPENGSLTISNGATVTTGSGGVGMDGTGNGTLLLTGAGSSLTTAANATYGVAGNFYAAYAGTGTITVADGASLAVGNQLRIAWESGSTGSVIVGAAAGSAPVAPGSITAGLSIGFGDGTGTLVLNHTSGNYTLAAPITGAGTIDVLAGTTVLSGDDSGFAGTTAVTGGTLQVNTTLGGGSSPIAVSGGGTLSGAGTIGGSVTVADGIIAPGNPTGALTINGNLALSSQSELNFTLGQAGTAGGSLNSVLVVNGNLTLAGTANVTQSLNGTYGPGLYRLISYSGALTDNGLVLGTVPAGSVNYLQTDVAGQVNLVNTQGVVARYWDGDAAGRDDGAIAGGNGTWTAARSGATSDNWTVADGSLNGAFESGSFAVFQGTAGTVTVDDSAGAVTVSGLQFATTGYLVTGGAITLSSGANTIRVGDGTAAGASMSAQIDSVLTGPGSLLKNDLGTLMLTATNTYTGGTTVAAGKLTGSATSFGTGAIVDNAALVVTGGGTLANAVSGSGTLEKTGTGTLTLTAANNFTGGTTISGGTLVATTSTLPGSVVDNAVLEFNQNVDGTFAGNISGTGSVVKDGTGTVTLTGLISYAGSTTVLAGQLVGNTSVIGGTVANAGQVTFSQNFNGTYASAISGAGSLVKTGTGTITLTGANTYTGGTTVSGGTLQVGAGGTTGSIQGNIANNGTVAFDRSDAVTYSGTVSGSGSLVQAGTGTLVLTGANTYSGGTTVSSGTLQVGNGGTTGAIPGDVVNNGTVAFNRSDAVTYTGTISGTGSVAQAGTGTLTLTGTNTYSGGTTVSSGTLQASAAAFGTGAIVDNGFVVLTQATSGSLTSPISGTGSLTKTGAGTLTLDGASTYTGTTTVAQGKLVVGSTAALASASIASPVVVGTGGTLAGHGSVGATTVASGGTLSPGNSIGTLTVNGNLSLSAGSTYAVQVDPASGTSDLTHVTGSATLGGQVAADFLAGTYRVGTVYTILTADAGVAGTFSGLNTSGVSITSSYAFLMPELTYDADDVYLALVRNGTKLARFAATPNQAATANALDALPAASPLLGQVLGLAPTANFTGLYDALSGEIHATAAGTLLLDQQAFGRRLAGHAADRLVPAGAGTTPWVTFDDNFTRSAGDGNAKGSTESSGGLTMGADTAIGGGLVVGGAFRYDHDLVSAPARGSSAGIDSYSLGAYASQVIPLPAAALDASVKATAGVTYGWHQLSTDRDIGSAGFAQADKANYGAQSVGVFVETGYEIKAGTATIEPYVGAAWDRLRTDGFTEAGGNAALAGDATSNSSPSATFGLRGHIPLEGDRLVLNSGIAWQHLFGGIDPKADLAFAGGQPFSVTGTPLARDAALIDLGLAYQAMPNLSVGVSYTGRAGSGQVTNGGMLQIEYRF